MFTIALFSAPDVSACGSTASDYRNCNGTSLEALGKDAGGTALPLTNPNPLTIKYLDEFERGLYKDGANELPTVTDISDCTVYADPLERHSCEGLSQANLIQPLDVDGNSCPLSGCTDDHKFILLSLGISNATMPFCDGNYGGRGQGCAEGTFQYLAEHDAEVNVSTMEIVDGAHGGAASPYWTRYNKTADCSATDDQYERICRKLEDAGLHDNQVQAIWAKIVDYPSFSNLGESRKCAEKLTTSCLSAAECDFNENSTVDPNEVCVHNYCHNVDVSSSCNDDSECSTGTCQLADPYKLVEDLGVVLRNIKNRYPNVKVVFLTSLKYLGYSPLTPQDYWVPDGYETGFSIKWLIESQVRQNSGETDPPFPYSLAGNIQSNGASPAAPWVAWSPYLWADGVNGRSEDVLTWECCDFWAEDGIHPTNDNDAYITYWEGCADGNCEPSCTDYIKGTGAYAGTGGNSGIKKEATLLYDFFKNSQFTRKWFIDWHSSDWQYRQGMTISRDLTDEDLADFPVLVRVTNPGNDLFSKAQTNGEDILFTLSDGVTTLDHEIEEYDPSGTLIAWVRIPKLSASSDTNIYMYYGNASAESQESVEDTWSNNYTTVHHLSETSGIYYDSSLQNNDSLAVTAVRGEQGVIGNGVGLDGNGDLVNIQQYHSRVHKLFDYRESSLFPTPNDYELNGGTIEIWIKPTGAPEPAGNLTSLPWIIADTNGANGIFRGIYDNGNGPEDMLWFYTLSYDDSLGIPGGLVPHVVGIPYQTDEWIHLAWTVEKIDPATYRLSAYQNGSLIAASDTPFLTPEGGRFNIGKDFRGSIDEVRLAFTTRSASWLEASFHSQQNPESFITLSVPQKIGWHSTQWPYRQEIVIDSSISGNMAGGSHLGNFPVLISIDDPAHAIFNSAQPDGDDILFTLSDSIGKLDHEIEKYDPASGVLLAWVKVPMLYYRKNTHLYIYYGNPAANNQENIEGTWSNGFTTVHHFGETSGTHYDSSFMQNDSLSATAVQGADGIIGYADQFNGTDGFVNIQHYHSRVHKLLDYRESDLFPVPNDYELNAGTMEVWIKPTGAPETASKVTELPGILADTNGANGIFRGQYDNGSTIEDRIWLYTLSYDDSVGIPDGLQPHVLGVPYDTDEWNHITWVYKKTRDSGNSPWYYSLSGYQNGFITGSASTDFLTPEGGRYNIGVAYGNGTTNYFTGMIDEVRISNVARSFIWIYATYNTQSNPGLHLTFGNEELYQ